jgi:hypothetical protein
VILSFGTFEQVKLYKARHLVEMTVARHPDVASVVPAASIHALAKRATRWRGHYSQRIVVSIHAPVKEATVVVVLLRWVTVVSIHAPVKEATLVRAGGFVLGGVSIHSPVKEATRPALGGPIDHGEFRSTPP